MGKIIYSCNLALKNLEKMLVTNLLPASFQKAVKSKKPDPEELKRFFNEKVKI